MARAGMLHRGGKNGADGGDDVQRSLELLDQVLSEFDECEPRSLEAAHVTPAPPHTPHAPHTPHTPHTPDDDSPSLTGHQSEDDGYMSMNGRRAKFALGFRPTEEREESETGDTPPSPPRTALPPSSPSRTALPPHSPPRAALPPPSPLRTAPPPPSSVAPLSPPPPEEAERIISTLLPKVSPGHSVKRTGPTPEDTISQASEKFDSIVSINGVSSTTQTTFPKTRHQRPYGWEKGDCNPGFHLQHPPAPPCRFASLPYGARPPPDAYPSAWSPQRNVLSADKRSPSLDQPPLLPFISSENDKPYNEHPVTIYPGPNKQFSKNNSVYMVQKVPPYKNHLAPEKKVIRPDERIEAALSPKKIPPRTLAGSMERHREVCRGSMEDNFGDNKKRSSKNNDEDHFSDDSLEECFPPPPPAAVTTPNKRNSIAWEVSLDDDPLLTPGSTKVIGRRRRKSGDNSHSSTSSIPQGTEECDWGTEEYWPPPPAPCSPHHEPLAADLDAERLVPADINSTGTYVIRKGKNRKQLPTFAKANANKPNASNLSRHSLNRSLDADRSIDESSLSVTPTGVSGSHNSLSSYGSRLSSDYSSNHSRYSAELNLRQSRELNTPNSRYSIDLCTPNSRIVKEITSPKSRLSLDLNNGQDRHISREFLNRSPKNYVNDKSSPYVARHVPNKLSPQNRFTDFKKYSSTFDNIKSLMKEGKMEQCQDELEETVDEAVTVSDMPNVVRVVSLPSLAHDKDGGGNSSSRQALITTVEEEDDLDGIEPNSSEDASPLRKIENNISAILSQGRDQKLFTAYAPKDWNIHKDEYCDNDVSDNILDKNVRYSSRERQKRAELQKSSSHNEIGSSRASERRERSSGRREGVGGVHKSMSTKEMQSSLIRQPSSSDSAVSSNGDFPVNVQIVEHYRQPPGDLGPLPPPPGPLTPDSPSFPPLPPSPVEEVDDEYSEILQPRERSHSKADTLPAHMSDQHHRSSEPPAPPHRDANSLKTRSMETGFSKHKRSNNNFKSGSTDRRTLPTDMTANGVRRRTLQRQSREATPPGARATPLQTSASLPETPIFARGCDVPRTPLRNTSIMGPRQSNTMNSIQTMSGSSTLGGYGRAGAGGVERALTGAELLRLAGGPARGWYPRQRHRPASTEHLDRLTGTCKSVPERLPWDATSSRKPLTLPPNLTPKFFHKSPREALRRVTSLLIRKGNTGKEKENTRRKEATSPAARSVQGDDHPGQKQRRGFFKSLWKRSRHYSLEHP